MQNFTTFFLWALFACILCQGSFAEDQSGYICLIDDPKQNQCDSYCLTELSPRLNEVVKAQNTRDVLKSKLETLEGKIGEMQLTGRLQNVENRLNGRLQGVESKLERHLQEVQTKVEAKLEKSLHEVNTKLEGQLQGVEAKLERQLRGVENKLEGQLHEVQAKLEAKLDEGLLAVQTMIEIQLQAVVNQLQLVSNKIDAVEVKSELQAKSNKTAALQQADKVAVPALPTITVPLGFERIGNRYFRFVNEWETWYTAERRCRDMGGYLAAFRNEEEINAIRPKLDDQGYWTGINDHDNEGHFVSVASQKPAPFLKGVGGGPSDRNHGLNCVYLYEGRMGAANGHINSLHFICQADNET